MSANFSKKSIAVLGAGKMGGILIKALVDKHQIAPERVRATVAHEGRAQELSQKLGVKVTTDNLAAVDGADLILVCVKPQVVQELMEQISDKVTAQQIVISVAASVHTSQIESALGAGVPVVRAMPNTPCALGQGMTGICKGQYAEPAHVNAACALFNVVGRTVVVDEKHMDAVTALSAAEPDVRPQPHDLPAILATGVRLAQPHHVGDPQPEVLRAVDCECPDPARYRQRHRQQEQHDDHGQ